MLSVDTYKPVFLVIFGVIKVTQKFLTMLLGEDTAFYVIIILIIALFVGHLIISALRYSKLKSIERIIFLVNFFTLILAASLFIYY